MDPQRELQGGVYTGDSSSGPVLNKPFWAQITDYDGTTKYYAWQEVQPVAGGFVVSPGGASGDLNQNPAYAPNPASTSIAINDYVLLRRSHYDPALDWVYVAVTNGAGAAGPPGPPGPSVQVIDSTGTPNYPTVSKIVIDHDSLLLADDGLGNPKLFWQGHGARIALSLDTTIPAPGTTPTSFLAGTLTPLSWDTTIFSAVLNGVALSSTFGAFRGFQAGIKGIYEVGVEALCLANGGFGVLSPAGYMHFLVAVNGTAVANVRAMGSVRIGGQSNGFSLEACCSMKTLLRLNANDKVYILCSNMVTVAAGGLLMDIKGYNYQGVAGAGNAAWCTLLGMLP